MPFSAFERSVLSLVTPLVVTAQQIGLQKEGTKMFTPTTPVVLFAIAVLAVLVILAWFVGGMTLNRRIAQRPGTNSNKGDEASPIRNGASTRKAA
jgi:hypothetical protein